MTACCGQGAQGVLGDGEIHPFHGEQLRVLLDHGVLGVGEDQHQFVLRERIERGDHRQTPDEFRDHPEAEQVLRLA